MNKTNKQMMLEWYHGHDHLLLTGERGVGKTTLVEWFDECFGPFPGYRSVKRDQVTLLSSRLDHEEYVIGTFMIHRMRADEVGFQKATQLLESFIHHPAELIILDEVGYMERLVPSFVEAIVRLAQKKRLLIVLRRDEHALERRLNELGPFCYFDLSESPRSLVASSSDKS